MSGALLQYRVTEAAVTDWLPYSASTVVTFKRSVTVGVGSSAQRQ